MQIASGIADKHSAGKLKGARTLCMKAHDVSWSNVLY